LSKALFGKFEHHYIFKSANLISSFQQKVSVKLRPETQTHDSREICEVFVWFVAKVNALEALQLCRE